MIELLDPAARPPGWRAAVACPENGPLSTVLGRLNLRQFDYGFPASLNTLRLAGRTLAPLSLLRGWAGLRAAQKKLDGILRDFRPGILISCTGKDHFAACRAARRAGLPSLWWVNDIISPEFFPWPVRAAFIRAARSHAARVVVVSDYARRALTAGGLDPAKVVVIHNGISLEKYARTERGAVRGMIGASDTEPVIGLVGRLTPWKGQEFFLRLAEHWIARGEPGKFVMIGEAFNEDQAFGESLRRGIDEKRLSGRVFMVSFQADMAAILSDLDVFIHASLRPEPFGRVLVEAMAVGTPVIGARAGGVPEIIDHGETGLMAAPGNLEDYAGALRQLLRPGDYAAKLAMAGREKVRQHFSIERVAGTFDRLIAELTRG